MAAEQTFDVYRLPEEHDAIREAVRAVCAAKVAPYAAEADETGEFPGRRTTRCGPPTSTPRTSRSSTAGPVRMPWPPRS